MTVKDDMNEASFMLESVKPKLGNDMILLLGSIAKSNLAIARMLQQQTAPSEQSYPLSWIAYAVLVASGRKEADSDNPELEKLTERVRGWLQ